MTRRKRLQIIDCVLHRHANLGQLLVADDQCLYRLLGALGVATADRDLGAYLASFLTN